MFGGGVIGGKTFSLLGIGDPFWRCVLGGTGAISPSPRDPPSTKGLYLSYFIYILYDERDLNSYMNVLTFMFYLNYQNLVSAQPTVPSTLFIRGSRTFIIPSDKQLGISICCSDKSNFKSQY